MKICSIREKVAKFKAISAGEIQIAINDVNILRGNRLSGVFFLVDILVSD